MGGVTLKYTQRSAVTGLHLSQLLPETRVLECEGELVGRVRGPPLLHLHGLFLPLPSSPDWLEGVLNFDCLLQMPTRRIYRLLCGFPLCCRFVESLFFVWFAEGVKALEG